MAIQTMKVAPMVRMDEIADRLEAAKSGMGSSPLYGGTVLYIRYWPMSSLPNILSVNTSVICHFSLTKQFTY